MQGPFFAPSRSTPSVPVRPLRSPPQLAVGSYVMAVVARDRLGRTVRKRKKADVEMWGEREIICTSVWYL